MTITIYFWDGAQWVDVTAHIERVRHSFSFREIETLEMEIGHSIPITPAALTRVRMHRGATPVFQGVIYEKSEEKQLSFPKTYRATAYSDLIEYDRQVVFRQYAAGTKAGAIIKDLASTISGVDTTNVDEDDTPALHDTWSIENIQALAAMQDTARGTGYWLRMKPDKQLFFKPKKTTAPVATITESIVVNADYRVDKWRQKNKIIYVGAGGQVLAMVQEGEGDMPWVVHDPFLTDPEEAQRRAQTLLEAQKEYGRELVITMPAADFLSLNIDLGDTAAVNLPSLSINEPMYLLEYEAEPASYYYEVRLLFGGKLELLEDVLTETDVSRLFGTNPLRVEEEVAATSGLINALEASVQIQATGRTARIVNKPPLVYDDGANITLDDDGNITLASGYTSGSVSWGFFPDTNLFRKWLRTLYVVDTPAGTSVKASLMAGGKTIKSILPADYEIEYFPKISGLLTEDSSEWRAEGGASVVTGIIGFNAIKLVTLGCIFSPDSEKTIFEIPWRIIARGQALYPRQKNLGLDVSNMRILRIYMYSRTNNMVRIRFHENMDFEYSELVFTTVGGVWRKYEFLIPAKTKVERFVSKTVFADADWENIFGGRNLERINYININTNAYSLTVDTDHVLLPVGKEKLTIKMNLSTQDPNVKPKIRLMKLIWREG
ncbi:MAG: hypothetical protein QXU44_12835 [Candidatus Caldarchaeum sp.]